MDSTPNSGKSPIATPTPEQGRSSTSTEDPAQEHGSQHSTINGWLEAARTRTAKSYEQVRQAASEEGKFKQATAGIAAATALAILAWAVRSRLARRKTRWDKTLETLEQARTNSLEWAGQLGDKVNSSELADQTADKIRQAAEAPDTKPRAQGAAAAIGTVLVLFILKRAARRTPGKD